MNVFRRFLPAVRSTVKLWTVPPSTRGIADIPIRKGPFWDLGWPYPYLRPWTDIWDEHQREYLRRMDSLLKISPMPRPGEEALYSPKVKEYGQGADVARITMDKENLLMEMEFNVAHYDPEDLFVNVTGDWVIINGQHSIRADKHGYVTRQFTRQIHVPEGLDKETIAGRYTEKGNLLLSIKAKDEDCFSRVEELYKKQPTQ